ncbi:MAG TPA: hypothetical protein VIJ87_15580 [Pyrinomonadaceae bacterium]
MQLNISEAHRLVRTQRARGVDAFWDGYTIVFFNPQAKAIYSKKGIYRNGKWGYANRFPVGDDGTWKVDKRNVR